MIGKAMSGAYNTTQKVNYTHLQVLQIVQLFAIMFSISKNLCVSAGSDTSYPICTCRGSLWKTAQKHISRWEITTAA